MWPGKQKWTLTVYHLTGKNKWIVNGWLTVNMCLNGFYFRLNGKPKVLLNGLAKFINGLTCTCVGKC